MGLVHHSGIRPTTNTCQHLELVDTAGAVSRLPVVNTEIPAHGTGTYATMA